MDLKNISDFLNTYEGRDKCIRTLSYAAKLASGLPSSKKTAAKFKKLSSELSGSRVILRLLDDIPAIHYALTYNYKKKESDWLIKCSEVLQIVIDLLYCPIEHLSWAGEKGFIKINVSTWDTATTWFWLLSIYLGLIRSARKFKKIGNIKNSAGLTVQQINRQKSNELLTSVRLIIDLIYAVNYLPRGILWGGKMEPWQVGALGTVSSIIGLYQALSNKPK